MQNAIDTRVRIIPKQRQRYHSYNESVDEPARVIEQGFGEVEAEIPAEENEPVESSKQENETASPAFEEE